MVDATPDVLGILLTTSPESADLHTVVQLSRAAMNQGRAVRIFVMCDGAYAMNEPKLQELARDGATVVVCGHNAEQRHIAEVEGVPNMRWGSQYDLAQMSGECDRMIAFN